ncbi:ATP-dependent acyl-CoA ligase [Paroceanicella profunda]|uniref:ATP-dependent acyl-CoA ligase n=1 Tax=Paroceanicella profunda TaxID=2579971 RepID=A0A5B8FV55_9RHOB|nr:AMP-binding protein [Paroceanicella profunda]QDL92676.1 ATP-dependent acyl-CoA ligase [Paroceanicella profunda]
MRTDETVAVRLAETAARHPDRPFLNVLPETAAAYGIAPGEITYAEAAAKVATLTQAYLDAGLGGDGGVDRVGLLLLNRPEFVLHFIAMNGAGISMVPINPDLRAAELEYLISHSEMKLAVAVPERQDDLRSAAAAMDIALPVIGPDEPIPAFGPAKAAATPSSESEAALLYTSGTTGQPKGCVLPNEYFLVCGEWYRDVGGLSAVREEPAERMLTPLPVFHMNALAVSLMAMITVGGCLTVLDRFHPRTWWQSVRENRSTCFHYLGVMPYILMGLPENPADAEHGARFGFGAGIDPTLHAPFQERFGVPLIEGWAMTEVGVSGSITDGRPDRVPGRACIGRPWEGVETKVIREDGSEADVDEPGELLIRRSGPRPGMGFFREYLKNSEATAEAWAGGWFHTGDIVRQDAEGDFFFVDRRKNVIRRSGENIAAVEVESALVAHPAIRSVAVAAVPDAVRGDEVMALIVPAEGYAGSAELAEQITRWCLTRLAYYKAPGWTAFAGELPLTATSKIQRGVLKTLAAELVESGQAHDTRALKKRDAAA